MRRACEKSREVTHSVSDLSGKLGPNAAGRRGGGGTPEGTPVARGCCKSTTPLANVPPRRRGDGPAGLRRARGGTNAGTILRRMCPGKSETSPTNFRRHSSHDNEKLVNDHLLSRAIRAAPATTSRERRHPRRPLGGSSNDPPLGTPSRRAKGGLRRLALDRADPPGLAQNHLQRLGRAGGNPPPLPPRGGRVCARRVRRGDTK